MVRTTEFRGEKCFWPSSVTPALPDGPRHPPASRIGIPEDRFGCECSGKAALARFNFRGGHSLLHKVKSTCCKYFIPALAGLILFVRVPDACHRADHGKSVAREAMPSSRNEVRHIHRLRAVDCAASSLARAHALATETGSIIFPLPARTEGLICPAESTRGAGSRACDPLPAGSGPGRLWRR